MAAIHEFPIAIAAELRPAAALPVRHEPDWRRARRQDLPRYARLCCGVLEEARRLAIAGTYGPALIALLARASDLLDDIDDFLIAMDPLRDGEAYFCAADLHRSLEEIEARLPRPLRGTRFRAWRRNADLVKVAEGPRSSAHAPRAAGPSAVIPR